MTNSKADMCKISNFCVLTVRQTRLTYITQIDVCEFGHVVPLMTFLST